MVDANGWRILSVEVVHQLHFWLVYRSILVKEKVGGLKRDLIRKLK